MSISDTLKILSLEAAVSSLLARIAALEEMLADTRAFCEARVPLAQQPSGALANDAAMASVVEALQAGQSIRGAADQLGLDRNKVFRLRQRAIAEGCLAVSTD